MFIPVIFLFLFYINECQSYICLGRRIKTGEVICKDESYPHNYESLFQCCGSEIETSNGSISCSKCKKYYDDISITIYQDANQKELFLKKTFDINTCLSLKDNYLNDKISSISQTSRCLFVYEQNDCQGKFMKIDRYYNINGHCLDDFGMTGCSDFNDAISSISSCFYESTE